MAHSVLRLSRAAAVRICSTQQLQHYHNRAQIGNRDVVGFGINGQNFYADHIMFPMPAIRFKENTPDVLALREKEKGDWKNLSMEDKKALYRASFCQTFSEMEAPTGDWKFIVSGILVIVTTALWLTVWMKTKIYQPLPSSFSPEAKEAQLKRMIGLKVNPITGLASHWDYEKDQWKE